MGVRAGGIAAGSAAENQFDELEGEARVGRERHALHVVDVVLEAGVGVVDPRLGLPVAHARALQARAHGVARLMPLGHVRGELHRKRPRADERHVALEDAPEVQELVERVAPHEQAEPRDALLRGQQLAVLVALLGHVAELHHLEALQVPARALLDVEDRRADVAVGEDGEDRVDRQREQERDPGEDDVEGPLAEAQVEGAASGMGGLGDGVGVGEVARGQDRRGLRDLPAYPGAVAAARLLAERTVGLHDRLGEAVVADRERPVRHAVARRESVRHRDPLPSSSKSASASPSTSPCTSSTVLSFLPGAHSTRAQPPRSAQNAAASRQRAR